MSTVVTRLPRLLPCLLLLSSFAALIIGCGSKDDARVTDLETRVARLEANTSSGAAAAPVGKTVAYKEFGFTLPIPEGVEVKSGGLGGAKPSRDEGQLSAVAGGVTMAMIWTKQEIPAKDAVQGGLQVLISAQPSLQFRALNQGDIAVDGRAAAFGAFGAYDDRQALKSVGVIGAWSCGSGTFSMTVVGANQAAVESSYKGFTDGFKCP